MFNELILPGEISLKNAFGIYIESVLNFFDEILYYIAKFELKI